MKELFNVSQAEIEPEFKGSKEILGTHVPIALGVEVFPADGIKCERCWNYRMTQINTITGQYGERGSWPVVCGRCRDALDLMGYGDVPGMTRVRDWRGWLLGLSALVILLDRVTKSWVSRHIEEGDGITVIPHVFRITHVLNPGAAFSIFTDSPHPERTRWMLTVFSLLAAAVVFIVLIRVGRRLTLTSLALALVLGGALGNVWDRVRYATVIDFLEVHIVHYHWPDFNIADSAIVIGGILLLIDSLRTSAPQKSEAEAQ